MYVFISMTLVFAVWQLLSADGGEKKKVTEINDCRAVETVDE